MSDYKSGVTYGVFTYTQGLEVQTPSLTEAVQIAERMNDRRGDGDEITVFEMRVIWSNVGAA